MVKAWLDDDPSGVGWENRPLAPVVIGLDDDQPSSSIGVEIPPVQADALAENPMLTVRLRTRTGYDADANPTFEWTTLVSGRAIVWTQRQEYDADAGLSKVEARATLTYDGDTPVTESATVLDGDGHVWRTLAVGQMPDRLDLTLQRLEQG